MRLAFFGGRPTKVGQLVRSLLRTRRFSERSLTRDGLVAPAWAARFQDQIASSDSLLRGRGTENYSFVGVNDVQRAGVPGVGVDGHLSNSEFAGGAQNPSRFRPRLARSIY